MNRLRYAFFGEAPAAQGADKISDLEARRISS